MALNIPILEKSSTMQINSAMYRARGLRYRMMTPPVIVPTAIVTTDVAPVKKDALEADCRYCSSMYLGLMM